MTTGIGEMSNDKNKSSETKQSESESERNGEGKKQVICKECGKEFPSKNSLFRHLRSSAEDDGGTGTASCLSPKDYRDFMRCVVNREENLEKIAVLYGYIPSDDVLQRGLAIAGEREHTQEGQKGQEGQEGQKGVQGGDHAAQLLLEAIQHVNLSGGADFQQKAGLGLALNENAGSDLNSSSHKKTKINRSYGWAARGIDIVAQDQGTGALTEVLCTRAPPIQPELDQMQTNDKEQQHKLDALDKGIKLWVDRVNRVLLSKITSLYESSPSNDKQPYRFFSPGRIHVFDRINVPKKFNAELDATHRRVDYIMPADFLFSTEPQPDKQPQNRGTFFHSLGAFNPNRFEPESSNFDRSAKTFLFKMKKLMQRFSTQVVELNENDREAVMAKSFHNEKRKKQKKGSAAHLQRKQQQRLRGESKKEIDHKRDDNETGTSKSKAMKTDRNDTSIARPIKRSSRNGNIDKTNHIDNPNNKKTNFVSGSNMKLKPETKTRVLRRRRFHNFTPKVMAHEFLAYRRLDRFYHRATTRISCSKGHNQSNNPQSSKIFTNLQDEEHLHEHKANIHHSDRPFVVLSLTGDLFLNGQARAVIGLFIAIIRGYVDEDILDCVFDEDYTNLVPAPSMPASGLYAGDTMYMTWEGKLKAALSARCTKYVKGFCSERVKKDVSHFELEMQSTIARMWNRSGRTEDELSFVPGSNSNYSRNITESHWIAHYLEPWAKKASIELHNYRKWKAAYVAAQSNNKLKISDTLLPPIESVTSDVPTVFQKVLSCLRNANKSGLWPSTTPKRQLVMISTNEDDNNSDGKNIDTAPTALSAAHIKAKANTKERISAYAYKEGEGGASGSFSVGAMPGTNCEQPKGNILFPDLMKAAFELEMVLCPDREPSSTIAINRNAQFRPHLDNGAGAGQSTSLIIGLGTYVGGELVVEGNSNDIRYKHMQFNGWTQRHWTLPFRGERFSLVWFTPKGCEGVRGIDLCN